MLKVFIGYDPRQHVAFQTLAHSIWMHASQPVEIIRLQLSHLAPFTRRGLTEFTYSRFLVPYLCGYQGQAIFLDSDILCRSDIHELASIANEQAVQVSIVPHTRKFERPSVMVFHNSSCKILTPEYVGNEAMNPLMLTWAAFVGELPKEWNHLVGYDAPNPDAKLVHFTQGIPCWQETEGCEFASEWQQALMNSVSSVSFDELMGKSVHVDSVKERLERGRQPQEDIVCQPMPSIQ